MLNVKEPPQKGHQGILIQGQLRTSYARAEYQYFWCTGVSRQFSELPAELVRLSSGVTYTLATRRGWGQGVPKPDCLPFVKSNLGAQNLSLQGNPNVLRYAIVFAEHYCDGLIPDDYKKYDAPSKKGETLPVYIKLVIVDIDEISEGNMDFRLHMYLVSSWNDTRLNSSAFSTYNDQCSKHFWVPDVIFERAKPSPSFSTFNTNFKINADGSFIRAERLSGSSCIDYKSVWRKLLKTEC
ncbi:hypothetical protein TNCV_956241 [Trichonephila clavipes]|nr:hypothetical protein TNCV_956241 [Trichonephila clavipes]